MKEPTIQLLSDIHFEHHKDGGKAFVNALDPTDVDVLVLAGDTGVLKGGSLFKGISLLAAKYKRIVAVLGNHPYYGHPGSVREVPGAVKELFSDVDNVTILENDTVTISGTKFVGCTLWFPRDPDVEHFKRFSDFHCTEDLYDIHGDLHSESVAFLNREVTTGAIVITHHIPDSRGIAPQYIGSPLNKFFVVQLEEELLSTPKYWLFGHTHECMEFLVGRTKFINNSVGYPFEGYYYNPRLLLNSKVVLFCSDCQYEGEYPIERDTFCGYSLCSNCGEHGAVKLDVS